MSENVSPDKGFRFSPVTRDELEILLSKPGYSLRKIAEVLGCSHVAVSREIMRFRIPAERPTFNSGRANNCVLRASCRRERVCKDCRRLDVSCRVCGLCNAVCAEFSPIICDQSNASPHVCNACRKRNKCTTPHYIYRAKAAQAAHDALFSESHSAIALNKEEFWALDKKLSPMIMQGISVSVAIQNISARVSPRTIYDYIDKGYMSVANIDLYAKARRKPRKTEQKKPVFARSFRKGREYEDFKTFMAEKRPPFIVEIDTVVGRVGGKVLLTMQFSTFHFMLAFLLDDHSDEVVNAALAALIQRIKGKVDCILFLPLLLADNGTEFSSIVPFEFDEEGNRQTFVFYCDPFSSYQKPHVENNHDEVRRVLPKGCSFDHLTQADVDLMMSHINSYARKSIHWQTPRDLLNAHFGFDIASLFNITHVAPENIILKPELLTKKS
jgi:IS30 family transposase